MMYRSGTRGETGGGNGQGTGEATLTLIHLYALYRRTYHDFDHALQGQALPAALPPVAHLVAEFAESDARDGRPLRTLTEFQRALAYGAEALALLGWNPA